MPYGNISQGQQQFLPSPVGTLLLTNIFDDLLELASPSDCRWKPKAGFNGLFIIYLFIH